MYILLSSITTFSKRSGKGTVDDDKDFYTEAVFTDGSQSYMNPKLQPIDFEAKDLAESFKLQQSVQRTLIMHKVKIKNIEKWDNAKATDFIKKKEDVTDQSITLEFSKVGGSQRQYVDTTMTDQSFDFDSRTTTINEEIRTIEHAPMLFQ